MSKVQCMNKKCGDRRIHWCSPDTPRGPQFVEVPEGYTGSVYCSYTCAIEDGFITLKDPKYGEKRE